MLCTHDCCCDKPKESIPAEEQWRFSEFLATTIPVGKLRPVEGMGYVWAPGLLEELGQVFMTPGALHITTHELVQAWGLVVERTGHMWYCVLACVTPFHVCYTCVRACPYNIC